MWSTQERLYYPSFVEFLSEHQFTFVVDWVRQVALRDSPPFVGTSAET
jgi:hypothetical protein